MLRVSTDPGSPYYAAFVTPANGIAIQWRATQGGSSSQLLLPGALPAYLMVDRFTTTDPNPQTYPDVENTRRQSRRHYSRPRRIVEAEVNRIFTRKKK